MWMSADKCCLPRYGVVIALMQDHTSEHSVLAEGGARELLPLGEELLATDDHWGRGSHSFSKVWPLMGC